MGRRVGLAAGLVVLVVLLSMIALGCGDDEGGTCGDGGACGDAATQSCRQDDECDTGECNNGICVDPDGGCVGSACPPDECENNDDCPNGDCVAGQCTGVHECIDDGDCDEGVCADGICLDPTCNDETQNGMETAVDCGGTLCGGCIGDPCTDDDGCSTRTCLRDACAPKSCVDSKKNNDETDEDCGGLSCARCADHSSCKESDDCQSFKCIDDECAEPTCDDEIKNGSETDEDCGGDDGCEQCAHGASCAVDDDCETEHCIETCVTGPTAGFALSTLEADRGDKVIAFDASSEGDADIELIEYDWGDGFETVASHQFEDAGEHTVIQRVTDENGVSATAELEITISTFRPVRLSETDKVAHVFISDDGLVATQQNFLGFDAGVRSDLGIESGDGVFYFETTRLGHVGFWGTGVSTAAYDLDTQLGATTQSVGINTIGQILYNGVMTSIGQRAVVGFVVDYRGANPTVFIISEGDNGDSVESSEQQLAVTTPVFATYAGQCENQGPAVAFNFGSDTTNHPFQLDPVAALTAGLHAGVAAELTMGFGQTRARAVSTPPDLDTDGDMSVDVGSTVELTASADDAEDGDITSRIEWVNLATSMFDREEGTGPTFKFKVPEVGRYPISVSIKDAFGVGTQHTVMVEATGELPQFDPVRLIEDDNTGDGITISPNGHQAVYSEFHKMGVRANQGNYGRFWYFEQHRLIDPQENLGGGVTISRNSLNPMTFEYMGPSAQINFQGGIWHDLVHEEALNPDARYYGWAVDYRGVNPIVHIIQDPNGSTGSVVAVSLTLEDVWVPLYPQLYGDITGNEAPWDNEINFGETPFHYDPMAALTAANISTVGFEVGWGDANVP